MCDGKTTTELSGDFPRVCMNHHGKCKTKFCAQHGHVEERGLAGAGQDFDNMSEKKKNVKDTPVILPLESYLTVAFPLLCGISISTNIPLAARTRSM